MVLKADKIDAHKHGVLGNLKPNQFFFRFSVA